MTARDEHGRFAKSTVDVITKGLSLDQWTAYRDASTALDRAVAQAEYDVRNALGGKG